MIKKEIFINMENEIFRGNLLDIGLKNSGIVYNIYKEFNHDINLEYINGEEEEKNIKESSYDVCILMFSLSSIWSKSKRRSVIECVHKYLRHGGMLYIWDIDKKPGKLFIGNIKILMPGKKLRIIKIRNINAVQNVSKEIVFNMIKKYFEIKEYNFTENMYHIEAMNIANNSESLKEVSVSEET